jgi:hypothetical protein
VLLQQTAPGLGLTNSSSSGAYSLVHQTGPPLPVRSIRHSPLFCQVIGGISLIGKAGRTRRPHYSPDGMTAG